MAVLPTQINLIFPRLLRTKFRSFSAFPPLNLLCDLKAALKSWFHFASFSLISDLHLTVVTKEIHSNIGQWLLLQKKKKKDLAYQDWLCAPPNAFFSHWTSNGKAQAPHRSDLQAQDWINNLDYGQHLYCCIFGHNNVFSTWIKYIIV